MALNLQCQARNLVLRSLSRCLSIRLHCNATEKCVGNSRNIPDSLQVLHAEHKRHFSSLSSQRVVVRNPTATAHSSCLNLNHREKNGADHYTRTKSTATTSSIDQFAEEHQTTSTPSKSILKTLALADDQKPVQHDVNKLDMDRSLDLHSYRTTENNPLTHTALQLHKYYTVPGDVCKTLLFHKLLRKDFNAKAKAFNETAFMVRAPVLETKELLFDLAKPENIAAKVMLYGVEGCGKTIMFAQLLQSALAAGYMIICPVRQYLWNNYHSEVSVSAHKAGRLDLPEEGAEFLAAIKHINTEIFTTQGDKLRTHHNYTWSRREITEEGSSLEELINFGIDRPKYSCDVVGAFLKELRLHSSEWPIPTLVAVDGVNSLFGTTTIKDVEKKTKMEFGQVSLVHHLIKLLSSGWRNGSSLLVADILSSPQHARNSHLPRYLLQEEGFDALNPFIPVETGNYTEQELSVALDYLIGMDWIQNTDYRTSDAARQELIFLSNKNPHYLDRVTRAV